MAANQSPIFPLTPNDQQAQVTVANTNLNGTGTLVTIWSAGVNGSILEKLVITVPGATSADAIHLFWFDGTNTFLWKTVLIPAGITPSATVAPYQVEVPALNTPEVIPTTWVLKGSTHIGQATNLLAFGGNY